METMSSVAMNAPPASTAPPNSEPLSIRAHRLTRIYTVGSVQVTAIDGIDLSVSSGQFVVLKGDSGSGKSTLLSLLAGLDRLSSGALTVAGRNLNQGSEAELTDFRRNTVGMVFQAFNLLPTLTVLENVCLPALLAGRAYHAVRSRARELLDWLGLDDRLGHQPHQLSGGEMQRSAIARSLINDPAIVLADEPTGNLDSRNARKVMALLADLNRQFDRTVVVATHSDLADAYATMVLRLQDGRVVP
jgi:putative ABC transport system ATP-binding protein